MVQWVFLALVQALVFYWPLWLALLIVQVLFMLVGDTPARWLPIVLLVIGFIAAAIYPL